MKPRDTLPCISEPPRAAFLCGWWNGIAVGAMLGVALAVIVLKVAHV